MKIKILFNPFDGAERMIHIINDQRCYRVAVGKSYQVRKYVIFCQMRFVLFSNS